MAKNERAARLDKLAVTLRANGWTIDAMEDEGACASFCLSAQGCSEQFIIEPFARLAKAVKDLGRADPEAYPPLEEYDYVAPEPEVAEEPEPSLSEQDLLALEKLLELELISAAEYRESIASGELPDIAEVAVDQMADPPEPYVGWAEAMEQERKAEWDAAQRELFEALEAEAIPPVLTGVTNHCLICNKVISEELRYCNACQRAHIWLPVDGFGRILVRHFRLVNGFSEADIAAAWSAYPRDWNMLDAPNEYDRVYHKQVVEIPQNKEVIEMLYIPSGDKPEIITSEPAMAPMPDDGHADKVTLAQVIHPRLARGRWHKDGIDLEYISVDGKALKKVFVPHAKMAFEWSNLVTAVTANGFRSWGSGNGYVNSALFEHPDRIAAFERARAKASAERIREANEPDLSLRDVGAVEVSQQPGDEPEAETREVIWIIIVPGYKITLCEGDTAPHIHALKDGWGPRKASLWLLEHGFKAVHKSFNTMQFVPASAVTS